MSAYDEIISKIGKDDFSAFRKKLVSSRGSLISGSMPEIMSLTSRAQNNRAVFSDIDNEISGSSAVQLGALFIKKMTSNTRDYGFVFDSEGTDSIIRSLVAGNPLLFAKEFSKHLAFESEAKAQLFNNASEGTKHRLIARDMEQLKKKTDIQWRIHGSRLHYLVLGKISADIHERNYSSRRSVFPLAMFECIEMDCKRMTAEIEQSGFLNFSLDEKFFDSEIEKVAGGIIIDADDQLASKLNKIKSRIEKLELSTVENVDIDVNFSMLGIITGFETEYLDKTWEEILR